MSALHSSLVVLESGLDLSPFAAELGLELIGLGLEGSGLELRIRLRLGQSISKSFSSALSDQYLPLC